MQFFPLSVPTFCFLQEIRKNHRHFTHFQDLLKPGASFLQYNEWDMNSVEKNSMWQCHENNFYAKKCGWEEQGGSL